jgi:hypothetical protein
MHLWGNIMEKRSRLLRAAYLRAGLVIAVLAVLGLDSTGDDGRLRIDTHMLLEPSREELVLEQLGFKVYARDMQVRIIRSETEEEVLKSLLNYGWRPAELCELPTPRRPDSVVPVLVLEYQGNTRPEDETVIQDDAKTMRTCLDFLNSSTFYEWTIGDGGPIYTTERDYFASGEPVTFEVISRGANALSKAFEIHRVVDAESWDRLKSDYLPHVRQYGGWLEGQQIEPDFSRQMVVAFFDGPRENVIGFNCVAIREYEDELRIYYRFDCFQTMNLGVHTTPFTVYVLPKSPKRLVLIRDTSNLIGAPSLWQIEKVLEPTE